MIPLKVFLASLSLEMLSVQSLDQREEAILSPDGKLLGVGGHRRVMRTETSEDALRINVEASELSEVGSRARSFSAEELEELHTHVRTLVQRRSQRKTQKSEQETLSKEVRQQKIARGLAAQTPEDYHSPFHSDIKEGGLMYHDAPIVNPLNNFLGMSTPSTPSGCEVLVGDRSGWSDYGTTGHSCAGCHWPVTEASRMPDVATTKDFEPTLRQCPAQAVSHYVKLESIKELGCTECTTRDVGVIHDHDYNISATSDTGDVPPFGVKVGVFAHGSHAGNTVRGKAFIVVEDNVPPQDIDHCTKNPPGRRYALAGEAHMGELFQCGRFCTDDMSKGYKADHGYGCPCGFKDAVACGFHVELMDTMMMKFEFKQKGTTDAHLPVTDHATGKTNLLRMNGQEWEATVCFPRGNSSAKNCEVIGRVVLTGNDVAEGIIDLMEVNEKWGLTPCDLFYSSIVSYGPFIEEPAGVHRLTGASIVPPPLRADTCERFRVTAVDGGILRYETGAGLWSETQAGIIPAYHCPTPEGSTSATCPTAFR